MRRVALIAVIAGCSAPARAPTAANAAEPATAAAETLWDRGTFVTVANDLVLPDVEESFEIYRRDGGYRIAVTWKRPAPTGEPAEGEVTLVTDERFSPLQGAMVTRLHLAQGVETTRSTIERQPDGRLATEVIAADGSKDAAHSNGPNDWFIGGTLSTLVVALCQADEALTQPTVYPDKVTSLAAFKALPLDGTERRVTSRTLHYEQSGRDVIALCENGKVAGEVARGTAVVRKGDLALARVLEQWFR